MFEPVVAIVAIPVVLRTSTCTELLTTPSVFNSFLTPSRKCADDVSNVTVVVLPSDTEPPPLKPLPAVTVTALFCSTAEAVPATYVKSIPLAPVVSVNVITFLEPLIKCAEPVLSATSSAFTVIPLPAPTARAEPAPPVKPAPAASAAIRIVPAFASRPVPASGVDN